MSFLPVQYLKELWLRLRWLSGLPGAFTGALATRSRFTWRAAPMNSNRAAYREPRRFWLLAVNSVRD